MDIIRCGGTIRLKTVYAIRNDRSQKLQLSVNLVHDIPLRHTLQSAHRLLPIRLPHWAHSRIRRWFLRMTQSLSWPLVISDRRWLLQVALVMPANQALIRAWRAHATCALRVRHACALHVHVCTCGTARLVCAVTRPDRWNRASNAASPARMAHTLHRRAHRHRNPRDGTTGPSPQLDRFSWLLACPAQGTDQPGC